MCFSKSDLWIINTVCNLFWTLRFEAKCFLNKLWNCGYNISFDFWDLPLSMWRKKFILKGATESRKEPSAKSSLKFAYFFNFTGRGPSPHKRYSKAYYLRPVKMQHSWAKLAFKILWGLRPIHTYTQHTSQTHHKRKVK